MSQYILDQMENTDNNIFISGQAGTGKSTLLREFQEKTAKKVAVLAPTGLAAINVRGQTIHSFFRLPPKILTSQDVKKVNSRLYKQLDTIVIDEVSMLRADQLDAIDVFLRLNGKYPRLPFGGIQMIFIGDLFQLPPVVNSAEQVVFFERYQTPYFFSSQTWLNTQWEMFELTKVYRQSDQDFLKILQNIRKNQISQEDLNSINSTVGKPQHHLTLTLTTTNFRASSLNQTELFKLSSDVIECIAQVQGEFPQGSFPTEQVLTLKVGAQVIFNKNDPDKRWVNGTLGTILRLSKSIIEVQLDNGNVVEVEPVTWENIRYKQVMDSLEIETEVVGSFRQIPLKLAWALTIHKAQGQTFDRVNIDFTGGAFAHGQAYVALSRCRSLDGLSLSRPMSHKDVLLDPLVLQFYENIELHGV